VSCAPLTSQAGTRQAYLPGGRRTGPPGQWDARGRHYTLQDEQVRVFVAPTVAEMAASPLRAYVAATVRPARPADALRIHGAKYGGDLYKRLVTEGIVAGPAQWTQEHVEVAAADGASPAPAPASGTAAEGEAPDATAKPAPEMRAAANEGVAEVDASTLEHPVVTAAVPVEVAKASAR
jgi:hypothetical protein